MLPRLLNASRAVAAPLAPMARTPASSRLFSSSAAAGEATQALVKPKIELYGLPARYANALYSAAVKSKSLNAVEKDLGDVRKWVATEPKFRTFLENPVIKRSDKRATLEKLTVGMNGTTRAFLALLAENNRLKDLDRILATFAQIMDAERGIIKCSITTADKLDANTLNKVKSEVAAAFLAKGQTLDVTTSVDPNIIGGLQVQVGDRILDLSVASKINAVEQALTAPVTPDEEDMFEQVYEEEEEAPASEDKKKEEKAKGSDKKKQ